jgi:diguanylate cyclase (GGDEF)-like protein
MDWRNTMRKDASRALPCHTQSLPLHPVSLRVLWLTLSLVFLLWSGFFTVLMLWEHRATQEKYVQTVRLKAEMLYHNTQALRTWIGNHGGVYVVVDENVKPNPLLAGVAERDVTTPSGRHLTLYNSPAFLHQVMTEFEAESGNRIRLISLNPIDPENVPDAWERAAFSHLSTSSDQYAELASVNGQPFYRLMSPMVLKEPCLNCHLYDKSDVGSLIGAISISLDAGPDLVAHEKADHSLMLSHFLMWLLGVLGIVLGGWLWRNLLLSLEHSVISDALTGLCNRRELMGRLQSEAMSAMRYGNALAMVMVDIDSFKQVNDSYGHQAGDDVLKGLAKIMSNSLRISDLPARYGGEEFAIICPHTNLHGARQIAERVRRFVEHAPLETRNGKIRITISAGVAEFDGQLPIDGLISDADKALYQAKLTGRNKVCANIRPGVQPAANDVAEDKAFVHPAATGSAGF